MHAHSHSAHSHSHSGHSHSAHAHHPGDAVRQGQARRLWVVLCLSTLYMGAEVFGGLKFGSLALLADAGHTLSDVGSLVLGLFAVRMAQRPATSQRTYGHTRVEILAALAQGVALAAVGIMIFSEGIERLQSPRDVSGLGMMAIASGGLLVNCIGLLLLNSGRGDSINIRGVWLHVATDALGSVGVILGGLVIWQLGWLWADPAASIAISGLVLFGSWNLVRDAVDILMEAAPSHLDVDDIRDALRDLPGVTSVHDLHVWTIGNREISLSSHLVSDADGNPNDLLRDAQRLLQEQFDIRHTTVQVEVGDGSDPDCEGACDPPLGQAPIVA